jgi:hypothetical protein
MAACNSTRASKTDRGKWYLNAAAASTSIHLFERCTRFVCASNDPWAGVVRTKCMQANEGKLGVPAQKPLNDYACCEMRFAEFCHDACK